MTSTVTTEKGRMKFLSLVFTILLTAVLVGFAAAPKPAPADDAGLQTVLKKMDAVAATFHTAQANFRWETYERVIDEVDDVETGTIYYRKNSKEVEMMAEVKMVGSSDATLKPEPKYVLFTGGRVQMYLPKPDQVTQFDLGKNSSDFQNYVLVVGFGGSGQDLQKSFDVTYGGQETIENVPTARLELLPKSEKVRNTYKQITLWIDLEKGVSVQQKFISPQGDYKLVNYSGTQINGKKIPDDVFKLKTTSKTQTITPKG